MNAACDTAAAIVQNTSPCSSANTVVGRTTSSSIASRPPLTAALRSAGSQIRNTQRAFGSDGIDTMTRIAASSRNWAMSGIDIIAMPGSQNPAPRLRKAIESADDMISASAKPA